MTEGCVRAWRRVLAGGAMLWALLVVFSPWLASSPFARPILAPLSAAAYLVGSVVCHQRPDRSFHLWGARLPVCGRCTGLYVGAGVGAAAAWAFGRWRRTVRRAGAAGPVAWRSWLIGSALPTAVSVCGETAGWWHGSNGGRAAAALPLGLVVGAVLAQFTSFEVD